ncbi:hypothetical protein RJ641_024209 [Dillenia turbinata]|uniref:Centromere protein C n=1 Tax=Dillenia turbinata TaxID=194707 RepID=A0AAN8UJ74_9MAGN
MVNGLHTLDPTDPFRTFSTLSLFPQTFRASDLVNIKNNDIESLHSVLKSMALGSATKLLEQAKMIVDGSSELNSDVTNYAATKHKNEPGVLREKTNIQERRPDLGRKKARFSLKPNKSQPSVSLEPSLDIDQLHNPEEYFLAQEKLESQDPFQKKSASYKHQYSFGDLEDAENLMSQENSTQCTFSPEINNSQPETAGSDALNKRETFGSLPILENNVGVLDELLSSNCADLGEDKTVSYLQELLNIKTMNIRELCLPDMPNVLTRDVMASSENWVKYGNELSDISNQIQGIYKKSSLKNKHEIESSATSLASPTPPKIPFQSISLLRKHLLQSNAYSDPFSPLHIDISPARDSSLPELAHEQSVQVHKGDEQGASSNVRSMVLEDNNSITVNVGPSQLVTRALTCDVDQNLASESDQLHKGDGRGALGKVQSVVLEEDDIVTTNLSSSEMVTGASMCDIDQNLASDSSRVGVGIDVGENGLDNIGGVVNVVGANEPNKKDGKERTVSAGLPLMDEPSKIGNLSSQRNQSNPTVDLHCQLDPSNPTVDLHCQSEVSSKSPHVCPDEDIELPKEPSSREVNKQNKVQKLSRKEEKRKRVSKITRRQSLAAAGTSWEGGVRRSTRVRTRPLEYWKGERLLYGRIHQSLATVIGLKYASPAKDGGSAKLKVKSFVSDEYKELVELAAMH